jgi:hypothetical protein
MQSSFDNYEVKFDSSKMTIIIIKNCNPKMAIGPFYLHKRLQFHGKRLCNFFSGDDLY